MKKEKVETILHQSLWYFIIFSIAGIMIETIYCYATTGVIESRKGLMWGPFCPVYGVSAAVLILCLGRYRNKNILELFIYGLIAGSMAEYILSFVLEAIYGMRFWDYTYTNLHLNGRICLLYSTYWGILSVILIKLVKPILDKIIDKIASQKRMIVDIGILIFFIINCIITVWGVQTYQDRVVKGIRNKEETNNPIICIKQKIENDYFTDERMSKTFPNLRIKDKDGNEVWVRTLIEK